MRQAILYIVLTGLFALSSCKVDQICAAYQSYYLLSPGQQPSAFSLQAEDSVPGHYMPELFALVSEDGLPRKDLPYTEYNKNGLVKQEWAMVKNWQMRRVPMEVVAPEPPDSMQFKGDELMYAERDVVDSVALDSVRQAAYSYKYNNDQKFYNWYFRDKLVWQDELTQPEEAIEETAPEEEKGDKKPFFQRIFKKKEKPKATSGGQEDQR